VFILPRRIKNSFLSRSPVTSEPITAACPLPRAGIKEQRGDAIKDAPNARKRDLFFNSFFMFLIVSIFCSGSVCFFIIEVNREEAPNKPVSIGNKGSFKFKLREAMPRKPASKKIIIAQDLLVFSK